MGQLWTIAGVHPPVVSCSCTILMGSWSCSHLPLCQPTLLRLRSQEKKAHTGVIQIHNANSEISIWVTTHKSEALEPLKLPVQVKHGPSVCISFTAPYTKCPVWHCLVHSLRNKRTSTLLRCHRCWKEGGNKYFKVAIIKLFQIVGNLNWGKKDKKKRHQFEDRKLPWPLWRSAQQSLAEKQCRGERQLSHAQHRESGWQTARPSTIDVMAVHQCPENRKEEV